MKKTKKYLSYIITIVCVCTLCFSAYKIFTYYQGTYNLMKQNSELESLIKEPEEVSNIRKMSFSQKYEELLERNSDMVAWIKVENTKINYPVMLTPNDGEFYLRRNFDKEYEFRGTLFFNPTADFYSNNMIVYGHNMDDGTMFGALRKYTNESYYNEHRYIELETKWGNRKYEIAYVFKTVDVLDHPMYVNYYDFIDSTEEEFKTQIESYQGLSLYTTGVKAEYGDKLLTLSTCEYSHENGRLVIVAKMIEE